MNALGPSMVAKLAPQKIKSVMMGMWFIATALGGILSGNLADLTSIKKAMLSHHSFTMHVYSQAFLEFAVLSAATSLLVLVLAKPYRSLIKS